MATQPPQLSGLRILVPARNMSLLSPAAHFSRDRSSWTASGGSKPSSLSPYRRPNGRARCASWEHISYPRAYLTTALVPVVGLGGPRATAGFCARTTKQQLQNQGMEIVVGWEPKDEVGTTQAVHGPTEAFQQGQKLRSPPSTTDTVATNENRSGRREAERSHPRERGGCEGGRRRGRSDHGDSGFPLLGRMPFRKWARAARVGVVCLGKGSQGPAGMEPGPESMTTMIGESKFSLKVRVLSGSLRRNERASSARCEGGGQWSSR